MEGLIIAGTRTKIRKSEKAQMKSVAEENTDWFVMAGGGGWEFPSLIYWGPWG